MSVLVWAPMEGMNIINLKKLVLSPKRKGYTTDQIPRQHSDLKQNSKLKGPVLLLTVLDLLSVSGPDQDPSCVCTWTFKHTDSSFL
jgi:hypothetical protein